MEKVKEQKEFKLQQTKMIVEKYRSLQGRRSEEKVSESVETTNPFIDWKIWEEMFYGR